MTQQRYAKCAYVGLHLGPELLDQNCVHLEDEEVQLEVGLLEHRVEEVKERSHLRQKRGQVFDTLHGTVQLFGTLKNSHIEVQTSRTRIRLGIGYIMLG